LAILALSARSDLFLLLVFPPPALRLSRGLRALGPGPRVEDLLPLSGVRLLLLTQRGVLLHVVDHVVWTVTKIQGSLLFPREPLLRFPPLLRLKPVRPLTELILMRLVLTPLSLLMSVLTMTLASCVDGNPDRLISLMLMLSLPLGMLVSSLNSLLVKDPLLRLDCPLMLSLVLLSAVKPSLIWLSLFLLIRV